MDNPQIHDDEVRDLAYLLWEQEGKPEDRSEHFWLLAKKTLRSKALVVSNVR
jgi:Protein of unknown function (DUF2934)